MNRAPPSSSFSLPPLVLFPMSDGHNSPADKSPSVVGRLLLLLLKFFILISWATEKGRKRFQKKKRKCFLLFFLSHCGRREEELLPWRERARAGGIIWKQKKKRNKTKTKLNTRDSFFFFVILKGKANGIYKMATWTQIFCRSQPTISLISQHCGLAPKRGTLCFAAHKQLTKEEES